ncbi:MAG: hypothetical protein EP343_15815 [Deltaproteobacteria bacterium]|nr:MAG: hypothetical protein EP343_15815 [Deltaproteobacteria bacterium]
MLRKITILSLALVWSVSLTIGCSSPKDSCGAGTTWDEAAQKCVWTNDTKLRCSDDTELKDGKCVPKVETCQEDQILDEKTGKCVNRSEQCGADATLNKNTGKCEPTKLLACGPGTKEENGKCVPESKLVCGANTKEENGKCVPDTNSVCADDAKFDTQSGKCVPKKVVECSGDTVNKNDKCIPKSEFCDAGTKLDETTGKCIVDATTCDKGSQLDAQTGKCVVSDKVCTGNTVFSNGQCVPKKEVCQAGTKFDDTTKTCLPDATCKQGDILVKGLCYTPATKIATEKDLDEAENNDPEKGGTANEITLKEAGKKTVFVGTIGEPQDLDNDGKPDQDIDTFTFKAKAGKWYKIYVQSMGLPAPAFIVRGLYDATNKTYRYTRVSSLAQGAGPGRFVFIPEDGDYTISVAPSVVLASASNFNPAGPFAYGPVGSKDWEYVGVVEELAAPTATKLDVSKADPAIKGDLSKLASENVYELTNNQPSEFFEVELTTVPAGVRPVVLVWDGTKLVSESRFNTENKAYVSLPATGTATLIVDWDLAWGNNTAYEGKLKSNGVAAEFTAVSGAPQTLKVKVPPLTLVVLTFQLLGTLDSYVSVKATDAQATTVYSDSFQYYDDVGAFFSEKGGDYTVTIDRSSTTPMPIRFLVTFRPVISLGVDKKPLDTMSYTETKAVAKNQLRYFFFKTKEDAELNGVIEGGSGPSEDVDASLFTDKIASVATGQTAGNVSWTKQFIKAGGYLVEMISRVDLPKGYKINFTLAEPPPAEKEPNETQQTASTYKIGTKLLGEYTGGDKDFYKITLAQDMAKGEVLTILVNSSKSYGKYKCRFVTASGAVLWDNEGHGRYGCYVQVSDLLKGDFYLETEYDTTTSSKYAYEITSKIVKGTLEKEPNNDDQTAQLVPTGGLPIFGTLNCDNITTSSKTSTSCTQAEVTQDTYDVDIPKLNAGESFIFQAKYNGSYPYTGTTYYAEVELFDPGTNKVLLKGRLGGDVIFSNKEVPVGRYNMRIKYGYSTMYKYYDFHYELNLAVAKISVTSDSDATTQGSNDTFAKAQVITAQPVIILQGDVTASVKDYDYYKITLAADVPTGKKLVINLDQGPATGSFGNTSSVQLHVYDGAEKLIDEKTGYTGYPKTVEIAAAKKGVYYIMIDRDSTSTSYSGVYNTKIEIK